MGKSGEKDTRETLEGGNESDGQECRTLLPRQVQQEYNQAKKPGGKENQDYGYSLQVWALTVKAERRNKEETREFN